ncbi:phage tail protein [Gilliamella sp. wkB18]|uniref:phage protein n=1 Tax=Gilliamella sp. wkB18 TaxID=3120260 RepID=UPI00080E984D|nr:phage protein [Gilliamella apicola]OCG63814.1 phage tail protein [Gilliamella apicola]
MGSRITGKSFDVNIGGELVQVKTATLSITDNSAAASTNGVPDGYVAGSVTAEGALTFSSKYFNKLIDFARNAGSFRNLPNFDLMFYADTGDESQKIEAFGCRLKISDLLNADKSSDDETTHTIDYIVTSPDFVSINGVPYLSATDTRNLLNY